MRQSRPNWFLEPHSPNTVILISSKQFDELFKFFITENVKAEKKLQNGKHHIKIIYSLDIFHPLFQYFCVCTYIGFVPNS